VKEDAAMLAVPYFIKASGTVFERFGSARITVRESLPA
jgi:hypothetical protein